MPSKSDLYIILLLFTSLLVGYAFADTYTVNPSGSQQDQDVINEALQKAYDNGGGIVYLSEGDYYITGPLKIGSNTKLTGDKNAIIHVSSSSSQWFVGAVGIIVPLNYPLINVEISDFQLDGNLMSFPTSYADYAGGDHNAERAIYLQGISNSFMQNIKVHDLQVYNFYSDGIHIQFAQDVQVYSNFVSNCQHSGIFYVSVISGLIQANDVAGVTSDCVRIDNGVNCKITGNVLYSYNGTDNNGAYEGGQNLIQIADQGYSHGGGSDKPTHTTNIEIYGNVFASPVLRTLWIDSTGKGVENVFVHDNTFINSKTITTDGHTFNLSDIPGISLPTYTNVSETNPPSKEMSQNIFNSIYNILNVQYVNNGVNGVTSDDINYTITETEQGKIAGGVKIIGFSNLTTIDNKSYISSPDDVLVKSSVIKNPSLQEWKGGISKIDKNVTVTIKNGTATANMNVTVKWYNYKKDTGTGAKYKGKLSTSVYAFHDSTKAPEVLTRPSNVSGHIYEFKGQSKHSTRVSVNPHGLQRVVYTYNGTYAEHVFMIGEKDIDSNGVPIVKFYTMDYWTGNLSHYADTAYINGTFEKDKLKVTAYTVYEEVPVSLDYELNEWNGKSTDNKLLYINLKILFLIYILWKILRIPKF